MKIKTWHILGTAFCIILGSILHFIYEWSGFQPVFALFGSVNESVWEHLKLLYWPYMITVIAELWVYGKNTSGFFGAKAMGLVLGMFFITSAFYIYTGIIGKNFHLVNILLFAIGVIVAFTVSYRKIKYGFKNSKKADTIGMIVLLLFAILFLRFTFNPPDLGIFKSVY